MPTQFGLRKVHKDGKGRCVFGRRGRQLLPGQIIWLGMLALCGQVLAGQEPSTPASEVVVPRASVPLLIRIQLPGEQEVYKAGDIVELTEKADASAGSSGTTELPPPIKGWVLPGAGPAGQPECSRFELLAVIPPSKPTGETSIDQGLPEKTGEKPSIPVRRFAVGTPAQVQRMLTHPSEVAQGPEVDRGGFSFTLDQWRLILWENNRAVLVYNHSPVTAGWVPENDSRRTRACYIHPVFGLDGEVLTDDFPKDHYHHHGIFWTWPHIQIEGVEYDLWADRGIRQRFRQWLGLWAGPLGARFSVENGWYVGDRLVVIERIWVTVWPTLEKGRFVDFELFFQPQGQPVTLWGAPGKSYGGMTMRFRVRPDRPVKITVPDGLTSEDLLETRLRWADLTSQFGEGTEESGATLFVRPDHPNFPPTWLTRHYGPLCVGWPGVEPRTLPAGETVRLPYRVWIHRDWPPVEGIEELAFALSLEAQAQVATSR
ncbi:MAG: DUF6807 family protein [Thermoguttaceae bacterium]|nr:DUF6807 family protein [Thermoguttaceae bacterium]